MATPDSVRLRRTWPQRFLLLFNVLVIGACIAGALSVRSVEETVRAIPRVTFAEDVLITEYEPGSPVNFLLVGTDSSAGFADDDPRRNGRFTEDEDNGIVRADSIVLLRLHPTTGQAAVLSIPRDLAVDIAGREQKINAALLGGREQLVETVTNTFDVEINHYVQVDFAGFADVIDVIGGVHVWFEHPARDSFFFIEEAGCHNLDGDAALAYVRGRTYQEFIDDRWRITGGNDLFRVKRQQDFLVLALEAAFAKGGRNVVQTSRMIDAASGSVELDDQITAKDLLDLATAFSTFDPERLQRFSLPIFDDVIGADEIPEDATEDEIAELDKGLAVLRLHEDEAEPIFDVFRGEAGFLTPDDITVFIGGTDQADVLDARSALGERGFVVNPSVKPNDGPTVLRYSPDQSEQAELIARFLVRLPVVEVLPGEGQLELLIGSDYEAVSLIARPESEVEGRLATAPTVTAATTTTLGAADGSVPPGSVATTDDPSATSPAAGPTTTQAATTAPATEVPEEPAVTTVPETTTTIEIIGRPPDGVSCP